MTMKYGTGSAAICLFAAVLFWSLTGLFVKHFSLAKMDADVQNLFRYVAATVGLWIISLIFYRREIIAALRRWQVFLLPTFFNCAFQLAMVGSLYQKSVYPGFTSLVSKSSVIFSALLAFAFFRDERRTILSWRYLAGCALGIAGVTGVVLFGPTLKADFNLGTALVLLSALMWACYTLAMKRPITTVSPVVSFTIVATYTTIFFVVLTASRSRPSQFFSASACTQMMVIGSGLLCIAVAHCLYFIAVRRLGVAVCASFLLIQPVLTGSWSAIAFGERLNPGQLAMAVVLLAGLCLVLRAVRPRPEPAADSAPSAR